MFNSMTEIHAAIRTMTNEELEQLVLLATKMLDLGSINQDQALEIMGVAVAHMIERSIKKDQSCSKLTVDFTLTSYYISIIETHTKDYKMAHELEIVNGVAQMAYAGETPWHGLGAQVSNDLTPVQMMDKAGH